MDGKSAYVKIKHTGEDVVLRHPTLLHTDWILAGRIKCMKIFDSIDFDVDFTETFVIEALHKTGFLVLWSVHHSSEYTCYFMDMLIV